MTDRPLDALVSFVVPVLDEEGCIDELARRVRAAAAAAGRLTISECSYPVSYGGRGVGETPNKMNPKVILGTFLNANP